MEQKNLAAFITKLLIYLGFSTRHAGFGYTREMLLIAFYQERLKLTQIYPQVSKKYKQPIDAIQTAVRTALKNAQSQNEFKFLETLIGTKFIQPQYLLPPSEFLSLVVEYLHYFWNGEELII